MTLSAPRLARGGVVRLAVAALTAGALGGPTAALGSETAASHPAAAPGATRTDAGAPAPASRDSLQVSPPLLAATGASGPVVRLRVPDRLSRGTVLTAARQMGTAAIRTDVVTANGGRLRVGISRTGEKAMDFPAFSWARQGPRAVVRVRSTGSGDPLAPRRASFTFGADFRKDGRSSGSSTDDGDNLIQRGLYGQRGQYKIQVDNARLSCRIKGTAGAVLVKSPVSVRDDRWYRVRCSRTDSRVELVVVEHRPNGSKVHTRTTRHGPIGSVAWHDSNTPLSVGGKLTRRGALTWGSVDQFNGIVYDPVLVIR
ncbi:laminin G domain-containing protein [Ornithinicoccus halotolerans]|uniref:laminin G domain-containing protein n=1 Tax=Ornithinicoccus halotolerans TaxID=1748220 RepID=UPI00129782CF|nr:laminin G domain-containing protein [Ornithinicoccus halotolerans]